MAQAVAPTSNHCKVRSRVATSYTTTSDQQLHSIKQLHGMAANTNLRHRSASYMYIAQTGEWGKEWMSQPMPASETQSSGQSSWLELRPREMCSDYQSFVPLLPHVCCEGLSGPKCNQWLAFCHCLIDLTTLQLSCIFPNTNDYKELHINIAVMTAHIVVKYIPFFSFFRRRHSEPYQAWLFSWNVSQVWDCKYT